MVHELIGIQNGRVDLSNTPGVRPELKVNFINSSLVDAQDTPQRKSRLRRRRIRSSKVTIWRPLATLGDHSKPMFNRTNLVQPRLRPLIPYPT